MSIPIQHNISDDFSRDSFVSIRGEEETESNLKIDGINLDLNHSISKEKFEDLPLHLTNSDKQYNTIKPHLVVEDKGEKRDYIGTYRFYQISEISEKGEKRILCYRRYDNFDNFYQSLKNRYPYYLIPKLVGKNPFNKIITVNSKFYSQRKSQLEYFLNYIYNHSKLSISREFMKFIKDPEFDEEFFIIKNENSLYDYTEASKYSNTITQKFLGMFSGYFGKKDEDHSHGTFSITEGEKEVKKMEIFYKSLLENFKEIQKHIIDFMASYPNHSNTFDQLATNFFYLKDVSFESQNTKEYLFKFNQLSTELAKVNKEGYEDYATGIEDCIDGFISILNGLCDAIDRYNELISTYHFVHKAYYDSKTNPSNYDLQKLNQEVSNVKSFKSKFEEILFGEAKSFIEKNSSFFCEILENFKLLLKFVNSKEGNIMKNYVNYYN